MTDPDCILLCNQRYIVLFCIIPVLRTLVLQAYCDLIESFGWKSFTILYQDNQGEIPSSTSSDKLISAFKQPTFPLTQADIQNVIYAKPNFVY